MAEYGVGAKYRAWRIQPGSPILQDVSWEKGVKRRRMDMKMTRREAYLCLSSS